jgi:hypothetical protein
MHRAGRAEAAWAVALATAALAGCSSSATYPYERDFVWTLAVAEATVWRPTLIDERRHLIISEKTNLAGAELAYKLQLQPDLNPFARRPSTRAVVSIVQTKPSRRRFVEDERRFLSKLRIALDALASRQSR